jgi:hypothetical protein
LEVKEMLLIIYAAAVAAVPSAVTIDVDKTGVYTLSVDAKPW